MRPLLLTTLTAVSVLLTGCDCGGGAGGVGGGTGEGQSDAGNASNKSDGGTGAAGGNGGGGAGAEDSPDGSCIAVKAMGSLAKRPVDIIFVIDNSGSMSDEIIGVEQNINTNFARIIEASGLDYRVIMIARHGSAANNQSICIAAPLSGNASCAPPAAQPTNGSRFFHYNIEIGSTDALEMITATYNAIDADGRPAGGWSTWLRADAYKVFVVITDDNDPLTAAQFETNLFALNPRQFGTAAQRGYLMHSIVGMAGKANPADPFLPSEPIGAGICLLANGDEGGENNGVSFQTISILTGGLRFPICDPSKYNVVFQKVAEGVVNGAQVACDFTIPPPPAGFTVSNKIVVLYTPGATGVQAGFSQVANANACAGASSFYVAAGRVYFCPDTCTTVKADSTAKIELLFSCQSGIN